MERVVTVFESPEEAERATRRGYRQLTPDERLELTVQLQRRYYEVNDAAGRLSRVLMCLNGRSVRYLVVGGHAVSFHGYPRFTHDVDVVAMPDRENAVALLEALADFGFVSVSLTADDFTRPITVALGRAPHQIDIMTYIKGVDMYQAWDRRASGGLDGVPVFLISKVDLIANKRAVGRPEDLADVARLESET